ncbi:MAG: hypothetical protein ACRERE_32725 [Candidatus Entotheonellia bacterium]
MICRQMDLQLLQLRAAVRSPGAADEHEYYCPGAEYVCETNFLAIATPQCEWRCRVANPEANHVLGHLCTSISDI